MSREDKVKHSREEAKHKRRQINQIISQSRRQEAKTRARGMMMLMMLLLLLLLVVL